MAEVDEQLGLASADGVARPTAEAVVAIRTRLSAIRKMLASLLERVGELEAGSDTLTRLLTRRFLPTVLRREIELADTHGHAFSIVVMDMDGFKAINDTYGHDVGDRVLQHVATLLSQAVRSSDYVFRLGGEEFLIVLVGTAQQQALKIADGRRPAHPPAARDAQRRQPAAAFGQPGRGRLRRPSGLRAAAQPGRSGHVRGQAHGSRPGGAGAAAGISRAALNNFQTPAPGTARRREWRISPYGSLRPAAQTAR